MTASDTASDTQRHAVPRQLPLLRWRWSEDTGLIIVFILMVLAIGIPHPEFFSFGSIKTILRQSALVGIIAFGMVYLVAMVEIDLSVGGIFAVASSLPALLIKFYHVDPWIATALGLIAGTVLGGINGVLTSLLKVPLIIVSLGTLSAYFGLHLILSDGKAIYGLPKATRSFGFSAAISSSFPHQSGRRSSARSSCILFLRTGALARPSAPSAQTRRLRNSSACAPGLFASTQPRWSASCRRSPA